jgi:hypothetical protein
MMLRPNNPTQTNANHNYYGANAIIQGIAVSNVIDGENQFYFYLAENEAAPTEQAIKLQLEPIPDFVAYEGDFLSTGETISLDIYESHGFDYTVSMTVDGGTAPSWMDLDTDNEQIDLDYTATSTSDEGTYSVTVTVTLDDFSLISNSTSFTLIYIRPPNIAPLEYGPPPSTTLVTDDSTCLTNAVYPLIYGDGLEEMQFLDAQSYSTSLDMLIGGFVVKSSNTSEGFVMRLAHDGRVRWQKGYNTATTNLDKVRFVDTYEALSFALVSSFDSSTTVFHVLKFSEDGTIVSNERVGNYGGSLNFNTVSCTNFVVHDDSYIIASFQGGFVDFFSFKNLSSSYAEYMLGFEGDDTGSLHLLTAVWPAHDHVNAFAAWNGTLWYVDINGVTAQTNSIKMELASLVVKSISPAFDIEWTLDRQTVWGVIEAEPGSTAFSIYYFNIGLNSMSVPSSSDTRYLGFGWTLGDINDLDIAIIDDDTVI